MVGIVDLDKLMEVEVVVCVQESVDVVMLVCCGEVDEDEEEGMEEFFGYV